MRLENGREYLYQWDKYQRVILDSKEDNMELHFACPCDGEDTALSVKPYVEDDIIYADIPNILLQRHGCINIYKYIDNGDVGYTYDHFMVGVRRREKPSDYVYIETEVISYASLLKRIEELEENGISDDAIASAVAKWLEENPIESGTSDAVQYIAQTLTEEQQTQARANIGAASSAEVSKLSEEIDDLILVMTESELKELTQEELAEKYEKGTKILIVKENENLVRSAINTSGEIYNGCGYLSGYRLNSSGGFTESEHAAMTGFIPYTYGKEIHINGGLQIADAGGNYINTYNKNFELISCFYLNPAIVNSGGTSVFDDKNMRHDIIKTSGFTNSTYANAFNSASYIRVSLNPCIGKDMRVSYI